MQLSTRPSRAPPKHPLAILARTGRWFRAERAAGPGSARPPALAPPGRLAPVGARPPPPSLAPWRDMRCPAQRSGTCLVTSFFTYIQAAQPTRGAGGRQGGGRPLRRSVPSFCSTSAPRCSPGRWRPSCRSQLHGPASHAPKALRGPERRLSRPSPTQAEAHRQRLRRCPPGARRLSRPEPSNGTSPPKSPPNPRPRAPLTSSRQPFNRLLTPRPWATILT